MLAEELTRLLHARGLPCGALQQGTRDIYYNANLTDREHVFIKVTRYPEDSYWFRREITEAAIAHELLEGVLPTPAPLLLEPLELSNGMLASVWEYVAPGVTPETARTKTAKLLSVASTLAGLTEERRAHGGQAVAPAGWEHSVGKAHARLKDFYCPDLEENILTAVEYIQSTPRQPVWIHGDLHSANMIDGTDYVVDWDGSQLSFVEWDLAHIFKEPFHYIDHAHWAEGVEVLEEVVQATLKVFPTVDLELVRQCVLLRRSAAILWKQATQDFKLERWYTTLHWFKAHRF